MVTELERFEDAYATMTVATNAGPTADPWDGAPGAPRTGAEIYLADARGERVPTEWGKRVRTLLGETLSIPP